MRSQVAARVGDQAALRQVEQAADAPQLGHQRAVGSTIFLNDLEGLAVAPGDAAGHVHLVAGTKLVTEPDGGLELHRANARLEQLLQGSAGRAQALPADRSPY